VRRGRTVRDVIVLNTGNELFRLVDDINIGMALLEALKDFCGLREGEDAKD